jgi:hypothetical protein
MLGRLWVFGLILNLQEGAGMITDFLPNLQVEDY